VAVVDGFRFALLGNRELDLTMLAVSSAMAAILLVAGTIYFRRMERTFADVV